MLDWLPEWLFEGRTTVYVVLGIACIVLLWLWYQTPRTAYLLSAGGALVLIALYALLDVLVETDREQIVAAVQEMSAGVQARNTDRIFAQVAASYNRHKQTKAEFRTVSEAIITGRNVDEVRVWQFEFGSPYKEIENPGDAKPNLARVRFMAKPVRQSEIGLYQIDAVMHRDSDGRWRLQSWEAFEPFHNSTSPIPVPGVP